MQKHLAASIRAAYFPAAFEPSPLVSNASSPRFASPRPVPSRSPPVARLFFSRQITNEFSCTGEKEESVKTLRFLSAVLNGSFGYFRSNVFVCLLHTISELRQVRRMNRVTIASIFAPILLFLLQLPLIVPVVVFLYLSNLSITRIQRRTCGFRESDKFAQNQQGLPGHSRFISVDIDFFVQTGTASPLYLP